MGRVWFDFQPMANLLIMCKVYASIESVGVIMMLENLCVNALVRSEKGKQSTISRRYSALYSIRCFRVPPYAKQCKMCPVMAPSNV